MFDDIFDWHELSVPSFPSKFLVKVVGEDSFSHRVETAIDRRMVYRDLCICSNVRCISCISMRRQLLFDVRKQWFHTKRTSNPKSQGVPIVSYIHSVVFLVKVDPG